MHLFIGIAVAAVLVAAYIIASVARLKENSAAMGAESQGNFWSSFKYRRSLRIPNATSMNSEFVSMRKRTEG